ncbi:GLPGLI family protein [uncultured Algibacter sp.]|uniref:GLPGLI family protein n=1 Tax=uncultured Algibacter sp. TaxID=298659 RepID=UPI0026016D98|nr:GLPGLI family protein [uncultured Algibacter sp.]
MKFFFKYFIIIVGVLFFLPNALFAQDFQGKAYYFSKTPMDLGRWGAKMSEQRKKEVATRLKNRLEKTYILTFNKEESTYKEDEMLDAISGATDSWGKNFTPGNQYKNIKTNEFLQIQEFYGKVFLVKDTLKPIEWTMGKETKQIGNYTCFKATCKRSTFDLSWYNFSWSELRRNEKNQNDTISKDGIEADDMVEVVAWYTPMIPVSQGPIDYQGLPGLILEVNAGNTTLLCNKIILNPDEREVIKIPKKGKVVSKKEYKSIITNKMQEFRSNGR